jgi:hypothetical protein
MKTFAMPPVLFASMVFTVALAAPKEIAPSAETFAQLVSSAERGDPGVDYTLLRKSYPFTENYAPYDINSPAFQEAWQAFTKKGCKGAMEKSATELKVDYLAIPMHFIRADCLKQQGDEKAASIEDAIGSGLAKSVLAGGDGNSIDTAYTIVSMREEGFILTSRELKERGQALLSSNGKVCDKIDAVNPKTGEAAMVYFDVTAIFAGMARKHAADKSP